MTESCSSQAFGERETLFQIACTAFCYDSTVSTAINGIFDHKFLIISRTNCRQSVTAANFTGELSGGGFAKT